MSRRAMAAFIALCMTAAGCTPTQVAGKATAPVGAAPLTTSAPATPTSLPAAKAGSVLLKRSELAEIVGAPQVDETTHYTKTASETGIDPPDCQSRLLLATMIVGVKSAEGSLEGNGNRSPDGRFVGQVVAVYEDARTVDAGLYAFLSAWNTYCPKGKQLTLTDGDTTQTWTAGPADPPTDSWTNGNDVDRMSTVTRREQPTPRSCAHVISATGLVVVESAVCTPDDAAIGQAATIVDRITAKLPK